MSTPPTRTKAGKCEACALRQIRTAHGSSQTLKLSIQKMAARGPQVGQRQVYDEISSSVCYYSVHHRKNGDHIGECA